MSIILLDFESRSTLDLAAIGGRLYWEGVHTGHTEPICCWLYEVPELGGPEGEWVLWLPGQSCPFGSSDILAAHNMTGFDRFGVAALGWRALDVGPAYIDTSEVARSAGLPGSLDELAQRWLGRGKNHAGNAVTKRLSGIKTPLKAKNSKLDDETREALINAGDVQRLLAWEVPAAIVFEIKAYEKEWKETGRMPPISPALLDYVVAYCRDDVEVLVHGWPRLAEWLDVDLPGVLAVDRIVNDRGIRFDVQLARKLLEADARNQLAQAEACARALSGPENIATPEECREAARSPKLFCEFTGAPNAQAATVATIDHPLARLREAIASIASGKLNAALGSLSPDGRLRDILRYAAAHTLRWGGKRFQPQNMPRPDKRFEGWKDAEVCDLASRVLGGYQPAQDEIDLLLRSCLIPAPGHSFVWGDYSAVEGRGLAWAADDQPALAVYTTCECGHPLSVHDGDSCPHCDCKECKAKDPYKVSALYVYPEIDYHSVAKWQRQIGKVCELALGYQGGEGAFDNMAKALQIDVSAIDRKAVIAAWRAGRQATVDFWRDLQRAMIAAVQFDEPQRVGAFEFCPGPDRSIALVLPSGRPIVYWGVEVRPGDFGPSISYEGAHYREHLYGGKIAENAIQAMCRDILADALVRVEAAGLRPVLHVHDEVVCEVPTNRLDHAIESLHSIMNTLPSWCEGFPPKAEIEHGQRYRK